MKPRRHPLRILREKRKFSALQVERATARICTELGTKDYFLSKTRILQIETTTSLPSPARAAALCFLYDVSVETLYKMLVPPVIEEAAEATTEALQKIPADVLEDKTDAPKPEDS